MKLSHEELKQAMSSKSNEELYDILYIHRGDYAAEALQVAREEFRTRQVEAPTLTNLVDSGEELREREEVPLEWSLRVVAFFFLTVCLGIPAMLAYRRYMEKGLKRKARDWARCALFGFAFYLAIFVIRLLVH